MANKRQRLAKQRFKASECGAPSAQVAQTALRPSKKHFKASSRAQKVLKRHPLRVAGKKPGEGCFICQSKDHVAKACPQKAQKERKMICLLCRKVGHSLKNCPSKSNEEKLCYNCGSSGHRLAECKEPLKNGGATFASCFLCKKEGHLSKNCPSNPHGIYPKGGCCKVCGEITHLAKDCPKKDGTGKLSGGQKAKLIISKEVAPASGNNPKRIIFGSGDDLEDDFIIDDEDEDKSAGESGSKKSKIKYRQEKNIQKDGLPKSGIRKAGKSPKVVNFK